MSRRIVLAGGSGFLGRILADWFNGLRDRVTVLTRTPRGVSGVAEVAWDGRSAGSWVETLEGADVVINLSGRSVDCRYTATNRRRILESRVASTRALGEALSQCRNPPPVWLNSSTATIYRHSLECPMGETGDIGSTPEARDAFSVEVAQTWEAELFRARTPGTRRVALRVAMVLGRSGGVYPVLRRLVRLGLGGRMASGLQYMSWIHAVDFCRSLEWILSRPEMEGAVNVSAPDPVPNERFLRELRQSLGIPLGLPATRWMLELGAFVLRTETELMIKSRRVVPTRLLASGFRFEFPTVRSALDDLSPSRNGHPVRV